MAPASLATVAFITLFGYSWGSGFLAVPEIKAEDLEASLLAELAGSSDSTKQRLEGLEKVLRPIFAAIPKEVDGTLSHNVVRYVLQRFFEHQHGWYVRGLEIGANSTNMSQSAGLEAMQEWVPAYLQSFLEKVTAGRGVNLRELAVLAATLEDLIHKEEKGHLLQAYSALDKQTGDDLTSESAFEVLEAYMMIYMLGGNWTADMASQVRDLFRIFDKKVAHWDETLVWLKGLLAQHPKINFDEAIRVTTEIGDRFATFNAGECNRLKTTLMGSESAKPGRVRLVDFYRAGLQDSWELNEKIEFLRDIGALDESDDSTPLVIIPNYMQSRTNCLAVSDFYSVCCSNECESLMQRVESDIIEPTARPSRIAKIVTKLSSPTVVAPRNLSKPLMQRLQSIAAQHGGEVPIHGRLFAQWMHHAFPRECPYPHAAGTATPQTADEWMSRTGQADSTLTKDEMMTEIASDSCKLLPKGVECKTGRQAPPAEERVEDEELPWDSSEELLVVRPPQASSEVRPWGQFGSMKPLHDLAMWLALSALVSISCWVLKSSSVGKQLTLWAGLPVSTSADKPERCYC